MASEKRLIYANDVYKYALDELRSERFTDEEYDAVIQALDDTDTVDAVEVVHAYWAGDEPGDWHCSHCKEYAADGGFEQTKYCPNCGAKMDGERKDNERKAD